MPKRPRGVRKKSNSNLTEDQFLYLKAGFCLDSFRPDYNHPRIGGELPRDCPFADPDELRQAWIENRDYLMDQVTELYARPWAFWHFEAVDRITYEGWYGLGPRGWVYYDTPEGLYNPKPATWKESEKDFLLRHPELMTDEEKSLRCGSTKQPL